MLFLAENNEAALGQHTKAADVVLGDMSVEWSSAELPQELGHGRCGVAVTPVLTTDPVTNISITLG